MADRPVVVDTNVLLNLATPVVDGRSPAPSAEDPLITMLSAYDVHVPDSVLGEVMDATGGDDLLAAAAEAVLYASSHFTTHEVRGGNAATAGLDRGETDGIHLANEMGAAMFVTDEFNSTKYLLVAQAIADRNTLFTTPHVLSDLAARGALDPRYVDAALSYYVETKGWDAAYIDALRREYL
jgi:hypothetical protein